MARSTRIYFATDLHGSSKCFRKFLNAGPVYKADVMILGGDLLFPKGRGTLASAGIRISARMIEKIREMGISTVSMFQTCPSSFHFFL